MRRFLIHMYNGGENEFFTAFNRSKIVCPLKKALRFVSAQYVKEILVGGYDELAEDCTLLLSCQS